MVNNKRTRRQTRQGSGSSNPQPSEEENRPTEQNPPMIVIDGITFIDESESLIYKSLSNRVHIPTKFLHRNTLERYGLLNSVETMLRKGNIEAFIDIEARTYPKLTLEFLSTFKRVDSDLGIMHNYITFRALGIECTLTYPQIAGAFGWGFNDLLDFATPNDLTIYEFWFHLSGRALKKGNNRLSEVAIPAYRIIYRCMASALFCMGEPSHITKAGLAMLWHLSPEGEGMPILVDIFVRRLAQLQVSTAGKISCGGMITLLVRAAGIQIPPTLQEKPGHLLNKASLIQQHFIIAPRGEDMVYWIFSTKRGEGRLPLPRADVFDFGVNDTTFSVLERMWTAVNLAPPVGPNEEDEDIQADEEMEQQEEEDVDFSPDEEEQGQEEQWETPLQATRREIRELRSDFERGMQISQTADRQHDEDYYDLRSGIEVIAAQNNALFGYLAHGGPWVDPTPNIERIRKQREDERGAWLTHRAEQRRHRHTRGGPSS